MLAVLNGPSNCMRIGLRLFQLRLKFSNSSFKRSAINRHN